MSPVVKYALIGGLVFLLVSGSGSANAADLIKEFEGFRANAYPDGGGWSVGYGSQYNFDAGRPTQPGDTVSQQTALKWLNIVNESNSKLIAKEIKTPITQNMRTAMLSLAYNIGQVAFLNSTLVEKLKAGRPKSEVAQEFDRWVKSDGAVNPVLVARRAREKALFLK